MIKLLLIVICCVSYSFEDKRDDNISGIQKLYADVAETMLEWGQVTLDYFQNAYTTRNMSFFDANYKETKENMAFAYRSLQWVKRPPSSPECAKHETFKEAYFYLLVFEMLARTPQISEERFRAELYLASKEMLDFLKWLHSKAHEYNTKDLNALLDFSIFKDNKEKGDFLTRGKAVIPCCWGSDTVRTWEEHYFWYPDKYRAIAYADEGGKVKAAPLALGHYGALMSNGDVSVTWNAKTFNGPEYFQLKEICPFRGLTSENDFADLDTKSKERVKNIILHFRNVHYYDIIVIQSQRDNTYFHVTSDYQMTTTNETNSWFVMTNVTGEIPVMPDFGFKKEKKKISEVTRYEWSQLQGPFIDIETPDYPGTPVHPKPRAEETEPPEASKHHDITTAATTASAAPRYRALWRAKKLANKKKCKHQRL